jgi:hypothetical protein
LPLPRRLDALAALLAEALTYGQPTLIALDPASLAEAEALDGDGAGH